MSTNNPYFCVDNDLKVMSIQAQDISNPVAPYPLFYTGYGCNRGNVNGYGLFQFPLKNFPVNCANISSENNNCLRIISNGRWKEIQSGDSVHEDEINTCFYGTGSKGNVFHQTLNDSSKIPVLRSFYCPPGYKIHFSTSLTKPLQNFLTINSGEIHADICVDHLSLSGGETLLKGNCSNGHQLTYAHGLYFLVIQEQEFGEMIIDMCVNNRQVELGSGNSLNTIWNPQSAGCDIFMTNICKSSDITDNDHYKDVCACFVQQQKLNEMFGEDKKVPVMCFGSYVSPDLSQACAFNYKAYKTKNMQSNACSIAVCDQLFKENRDLQKGVDHQPVNCGGNVVDFGDTPVGKDVQDTPSDTSNANTTVRKSKIPIYTWIIIGLNVLFLLLATILLIVKETKQRIKSMKLRSVK